MIPRNIVITPREAGVIHEGLSKSLRMKRDYLGLWEQNVRISGRVIETMCNQVEWNEIRTEQYEIEKGRFGVAVENVMRLREELAEIEAIVRKLGVLS